MKEIFNKPYLFFWISSLFALLFAFFNKGAIDINVHDTYFIIANNHLLYFTSFIFFINGFGYWLLRKRVKIKLMTLLHISITFIGVIIVIIILSNAINNYGMLMNIILFITILLITLSQFIYLINMIFSLFRNKHKL